MPWNTPIDFTTIAPNPLSAATHMNPQVRDNMLVLSGHAHTGAAGDGTLIGGVDYSTTARVQEDFLGGTNTSGSIGELGWIFAGAATGQAGEAGRPGIMRITGSSGTNSYLYLLNGSMLPSDTFDVTFLVRLSHTTQILVRLGLFGDVNNPPNNGVFMEHLTGDTNWFGVNRASSSQTREDTNQALATSWTKIRIRRVNGSTIGYTINASAEVTETLTIPTAALFPALFISTGDGTSKTLDIDFFRLDLSGLTAR